MGSTVSPIAYLSLVLWLLTALAFAPSAWRYISGHFNLVDAYRTAMFFMAALWVGGLGRLIFMPQAEDVQGAIR
jgi:hypothetical protein